MKEQTTKERILIAAEEIMLENSFHSVGLKQILDAVKVPKGSFYHYFKSKEEFGVEMLRHYMSETYDIKRGLLLSHTDIDPIKRFFDYLDGGIDYIQSGPGKYPCLASKLASEVAGLSESMRAELARGFEDWIGIFKALFDEAVDKKMLPESLDTGTEAQFVHDLWTGATQRAVINCSAAPICCAVEHIKDRINRIKIG